MAEMGGLFEILTSPYVVRGLVAIFLIAINASLAGSFTVFRNASFLVAGASHAALAGAAFFIVLATYGIVDINPLWGAMASSVALGLVAGYASRKGDERGLNNTIGIGFALSMSVAVLLISLIREYASRVWGFLFGDLLLLTRGDLVLLFAVTVVISFLSVLFYREFLFISFDMEGAVASGIHGELFNYLQLGMISASVVVLLKSVGSILVFAFLVSPAATAMLVSKSVRTIFYLSFALALAAGLAGLAVSFLVPVSPGAVAALIATVVYFVALVVHEKKR